MGKFKLIKPRIKNMKGRVPLLQVPDDVAMDPNRAERKEMYKSERWLRLRRTQMEKRCWAGCGRYATTLDHLMGHDDQQAAAMSLALRIPIRPTWQERFWAGPFISLCHECHSRKTGYEQAGKLRQWVDGRSQSTRQTSKDRSEP